MMIQKLFPETIHISFLLVSILRVFTQSLASNAPCLEKSQWEFALENSHYRLLSAKDYPECLLYCLYDTTRCRSLTYDLMTKVCKLNSETRWSNPSQYGKKSYNIYMETIGRELNGKDAEGTSKAHTAQPISSHTESIQTKIATSSQVSADMKTTTMAVLQTSFLTTTNFPTAQSTIYHTPSVQPQTSSTVNTNTVYSLVSTQVSQETTDHLLTTQPITSQVSEAQISISEASLSLMPTSSQSTNLITQETATASVSIAPQQEYDPSTYCIGKSNGEYLHPTDCSQYISCDHGTTKERSCDKVTSVCPAGC